MKVCSRCNKEIFNDSSKFCTHCGNSLSSDNYAQPPILNEQYNQPQHNQPQYDQYSQQPQQYNPYAQQQYGNYNQQQHEAQNKLKSTTLPMVLSIVSIVLGFLFNFIALALGIIGLVYASKSNKAKLSNNFIEAVQSRKTAFVLSVIGASLCAVSSIFQILSMLSFFSEYPALNLFY